MSSIELLGFLNNLLITPEGNTCYRSTRLRGGGGRAAQFRPHEALPSMGILRGGIPAPAFTSPISPQRNKFR